MEMNNDIFTPNLPIPEPVSFEDAPIPIPVEEEKPAETPPPRRRRKADAPVLTIESGDEIETEDTREAAAWHEIHNAYRTRRILSAPLGGIEQTDSGKTIAVVDYNGFRIVIPLKEMMVAPSAANSTDSMAVRQMKLLGNMLGAEIDFVILGIDSKSRSVVASRREAMMRKRQLFYFSPDANGEYRVRADVGRCQQCAIPQGEHRQRQRQTAQHHSGTPQEGAQRISFACHCQPPFRSAAPPARRWSRSCRHARCW